MPCRSSTDDDLLGFVLLLDDVVGRRSLATHGAFVAVTFATSQAHCFDLVLLAGASAVATIQS